ncbi:MAG: response regulator, partial [Candidatus Aminicenantes bacterium]|nr:response regulator [Candidatus Aminicenantes bacterium]
MLEESGTGLEKSALADQTNDEQAKKILVVEDDLVEREALEEFLQVNDFTVQAVASATEALKILKKSDFYLVLTDLVMPE